MNRPVLYQVVPTDNYTVYLYYDNGEVKLYDCSFIFNENGVFDKIKNIDSFKNLCTIMNHSLAFDISGQRDVSNCIDICPDTIYEDSISCDAKQQDLELIIGK